MKMLFGRKFLGCILAVILVSLIYFVTLVLVPGVITSWTMFTFGVFIITICFAYIGGNIWNAWIKSRYFNADMFAASQPTPPPSPKPPEG